MDGWYSSEKELELPPVLSVVLYTADLPWGSNTNIRDLLAAPAVFHPFAPDWGPVFYDLAGRTPERWVGESKQDQRNDDDSSSHRARNRFSRTEHGQQ